MINQKLSNLNINKLTKAQYDKALEEGKLKDDEIYLIPREMNEEGGGGGSQIQSDYNQNDETQMDYIKNRPFYTLPPDHNLDFTPYRKKAAITWDGVIQPNHPKVSLEMDGTLLTFYKVADDFITSQNILNSHGVYQLFPEALEDMGEEMEVKNYQMIFPLSSDILSQVILFEDANMLIGMTALSFNIDGTITVPGTEITLEVPSTGTYFLYDVNGDMMAPGYLTAIEGEIKSDPEDEELKNDPNITITKDIFGGGSTLILEKVSNNFIPEEKLIDSLFGMNIVLWDPDNIGDGSMSMDVIISEALLSDQISIAKGDDGDSYALLMGGQIPLFGSIKSPSTTINGLQIAGPGTYFCYVDMNKLSYGQEMWVDKFITPETVFQIDSKFIPKQKAFVPDYGEMDPSSDSYIANRPYYSGGYYNQYSGDITNTSLCVAPNEDGTVFYQWGYELGNGFDNPERYNKGHIDAVVKNLYWRNLYIEPNNKQWYVSSSNSDNVLYVFNYDISSYQEYFGFTNRCIFAYIALEDNITTKVYTPWSSNDETITFPKKGIYYLYSIKDIDNHIHLSQIDLYREKKNIEIQIQTTSEVSSYEDNVPISSYGVYKALGNRRSINFNNLNDYITSYADSYYMSHRYRGSMLVEASYNYPATVNGAIVWQYE